MASGPVIAPLPIIELGPNYTIVLEAIDPSTGNTVADVTLTDVTITARDLSGSTSPLGSDPVWLEQGAI